MSDETGYPAGSVGLSLLLVPLPHLPSASAYVIGIPLAVANQICNHTNIELIFKTPSKNIFVLFNTKIQKN
jgi:hypothetical protein